MIKIEISDQQNPNLRLPNNDLLDQSLDKFIDSHIFSLGSRHYPWGTGDLTTVESSLRNWIWNDQARWGNIRVDQQWLATQIASLREVNIGKSLDTLLGLSLCAWLEFQQIGESGYDLSGLLRIDTDPPQRDEFHAIPHVSEPLHIVTWDVAPKVPTALKRQLDEVISVLEERLATGVLPKTVLFELIPVLHHLYRDTLSHVMRNGEVRLNVKLISQMFNHIKVGKTRHKDEIAYEPSIYEGFWLLAYVTYAYHKGTVIRDMVEQDEISPQDARKFR